MRTYCQYVSFYCNYKRATVLRCWNRQWDETDPYSFFVASFSKMRFVVSHTLFNVIILWLADYFIFILRVCILYLRVHLCFLLLSIKIVALLVFLHIRRWWWRRRRRRPSYCVQPWNVHDALCCLHSFQHLSLQLVYAEAAAAAAAFFHSFRSYF